MKLFPLYGSSIGIPTETELLRAKGARSGTTGQSRYVVINNTNFWLQPGSGNDKVFYFIRDAYPQPM
jgi:hypothetical protein